MVSDKSNITIAVVGGGLGGVTAAIALGRAGYTGALFFSLVPYFSAIYNASDHLAVHLFEQAPEFSELGLGIGITPK
jgi:salicylate hydroxylase